MARVTHKAGRGDWETPWPLFRLYEAEFGIQTDVCAQDHNAKCARYFTPEMDAFRQKWSGVCWMNPPYGHGVDRWIKKALDSAMTGDATVVCLLPNFTETANFHDLCALGEIRLLRSRVNFIGSTTGNDSGSIICVFHAHLDPGRTIVCEDWKARIAAAESGRARVMAGA